MYSLFRRGCIDSVTFKGVMFDARRKAGRHCARSSPVETINHEKWIAT
jgi:hypothetical protein